MAACVAARRWLVLFGNQARASVWPLLLPRIRSRVDTNVLTAAGTTATAADGTDVGDREREPRQSFTRQRAVARGPRELADQTGQRAGNGTTDEKGAPREQGRKQRRNEKGRQRSADGARRAHA